MAANDKGEVSEWLKEHAWKACVRQKRTEGSNPSLSAISNRYAARKAAFFISIKIVELAHNSLRSIKMARRAYLLLY